MDDKRRWMPVWIQLILIAGFLSLVGYLMWCEIDMRRTRHYDAGPRAAPKE
jgi:hypothetical protein